MSALAEFVRASLWTTPNGPRCARLVAAAEELPPAEAAAAVARLEMHGILALVERNLRLAGARPPWPDAAVAHVARRLDACREDARRAAATRDVAVTMLGRAGIRTILLKGAALTLDVYPEAALRGQGDVDLLIRRERLGAAITALAPLGLRFAPGQFPAFWYRLSHFHAKLAPSTALVHPVELHWRLHAPALLLAADHERLWRDAVPVPGRAASRLHPADEVAHLATHLASHWMTLPRGAGGVLAALLADPDPAVRIKWIADLVLVMERDPALASREGFGLVGERFGAREVLERVFELLDAEGLVPPSGPTRTATPRPAEQRPAGPEPEAVSLAKRRAEQDADVGAVPSRPGSGTLASDGAAAKRAGSAEAALPGMAGATAGHRPGLRGPWAAPGASEPPPALPAIATGTADPMSAGTGPSTTPAGGSSHRPHAALDFRLEALRRLPRWIWPPLDVLRRRHRLSTAGAAAFRPLRALGVLAHLGVVALALPVAFVGRALLARRRAAAARTPLAPALVLDLVQAGRAEECRR